MQKICRGGGKTVIEFAGFNVYGAEAVSAASPADALIGERFEVNGIGYKKLTEDTVSLVDWEGAAGNIEIPKKVPGTELTVVSIGSGVFKNNAQIYQVDMPDTITDIGASAFDGASWTTITTLPPNLISIGEKAFCAACRHTGMEEYDLVIPDSVTAIGKGAFWDQIYIRSVKLPKNLTRLEERTFDGCEKMTSITFPENLKSIGNYAFLDCKMLDNIELPESITEIKSSVFDGCLSLTNITLPRQITVLEKNLFLGCSSLESITLPANLKTIESNVFGRCTALKEIRIPEGVTRLDGLCFNGCKEDLKVYLEGSLTYVNVWFCGTSSSAQSACKFEINCVDEQSAARLFSVGHRNLKVNGTAYEPEEADMQFDYEGFTYVIIDPEQKLVRLKGKSADAEKVTGELIIPEKVTGTDGIEYTVTEIGYLVFYKWPITKAVLPNTIVHIEREAFYGCATLTEIQLPTGLVSLGSSVFYGCTGLTGSITIPDSCIDISTGLNGTGYSEIILSKNITKLAENALSGCKNLTSITLPENLTEIGFGTFQGLTELENVTIPPHLNEIRENAFKGCEKLKQAPLSDELVRIGVNAFNGCTSLSGTLVMPDSAEVIMEGAFSGCTGLSGIQAGNGLKLLTYGALPDVESMTAYDSRVLDILKLNTDCVGDAAKLLWDGKSDIPAGAQVWIKDDLVISDSITIGAGAAVTITPDGSVTVAEDAELTIEEGGRLEISASASVTIEGTLTNNGSIAGDGEITISGELTNNGRMEGIGGLTVEGKLTNNGSIEEFGEITVSGELTNSGSMEGTGGLTVEGKLTNNGSIEESGEISISGELTNGGTIKASGAITVDGTLTNSESIIENGGLTINGTLTNNGTIEGSGKLAVNGTLEGTGSFGDGMQMMFSLTKEMVADTEDVVYSVTPSAPEPEVSVSLGTKKIIFEKDADFTYSYADNTMPGRAELTVTPKEGGRLKGNSVTKSFTIQKAGQSAPQECILTFEQNDDGKTFTAVIAEIEGAEYSFDGETWSEENKKQDCQPETEYTAYTRMKETETHTASPYAEKTMTAPKLQTTEEKPPVTQEKELAAPEISSLKVIAGKTGVYIQVEVTPVADADRYEIYRAAGTKTTLIGATASGQTMLQDENPVKSAKYYAVAVSEDGKLKSKAGDQKEIKLSKATKIKKVSASSKGITITWKKVKNAKKYVLYRSTKKNSGYTKIKTLGKKKVSYVDKKAKKRKKYYYKVVVLTKSQPSLMSKASKKVKR